MRAEILKRHTGNCRGAAMLELLLCMLPYMLVLLGAIFFWHLVAGKQEAVKFFTANSAVTDAQLESKYFFGKLKGTAYIDAQKTYDSEAEFNQAIRIEDEDEPVLPYDTEGKDIMRALDLSATQVYFNADAGGYKVARTQAGNRLAQMGLLGSLDTSTVYHEGDDVKVEITDENSLLPQVSQALGSWIDYRSSTANYSYAVPFGRGTLPFESNTVTSQQWRSSDGISVFKRPVASFWAVIGDPTLRDWDGSVATLSSELADIFKTSSGDISPSSLNSTAIDTTYIDIKDVH